MPKLECNLNKMIYLAETTLEERKMKLNKLVSLFLVSIICLFSVTACNTWEGMQEDAEEAGDEIEDATD